MKTHITKVVAVVMAALMMLSLVPVAALPSFNLPELLSVFGGTSSDTTTPDAEASDSAAVTEDGVTVYNTNTDGLYAAANGTLYMDTDGDGVAEALVGDTVSGDDMPFAVSQGKVTNDEVYYALGTDAETDKDNYELLSPYEPTTNSGNEYDPFLQGGDAYIHLKDIYYGAPATPNYPLTKWSANTSVYNVTGEKDSEGNTTFALPDTNLIDELLWKGQTVTENRYNDPNTTLNDGENIPYAVVANKAKATAVDADNNALTAYAYNRYDAMQGKWGITLDKNVETLTWKPTSDTANSINNTILYLSDTPYLYYSTEALDSTQIAISMLIGSPVQKEAGVTTDTDINPNQTDTTNTGYFEYRWYTFTDNAARPGIEADTLDNDMTPTVYVSDVVATVQGKSGPTAKDQQLSDVHAALEVSTVVDADNPIAMAATAKYDTEKLYVNGSITGCIDFTNILPVIMATQDTTAAGVGDAADGNGTEDVQYKVAQIRVDTKTAKDKSDSAARINYLYFGPGLSMVYTPQNLVGSDVDAGSFRYAQTSQNSVGLGDTTTGTTVVDNDDTTTDRAYTNGWENGGAVTITNTPNNPQFMSVDTYGDGDGVLLEKDSDMIPDDFKFVSTDARSKVWTFTKDGVRYFMEAEYAKVSGAEGYYIMVTVPVRKWMDVLGNARKISLTATVTQYGAYKNINGGNVNPAFVLWGNEDGALGAGHSGDKFGTRFRNEDLIMVFANEGVCYHADHETYIAAEVDRTIGDSVIYNTQLEEDGYLVSSATAADGTVTYYYQKDNLFYTRAGAQGSYTYTKVDLKNVLGLTATSNTDELGYTEYTDANGKFYYAKDGAYFTRVHKRNAWGGLLYTDANDAVYTTSEDKTQVFDSHGDLVADATIASLGLIPTYSYTVASPEKVYETTESWFDMLRSPYTYNETVKAGNASNGYGDELVGYTYISSIRFTMPVGSAMQVQNMKGDGNSAGLNMYSTSGAIVNAYDGGTGVQPEIDVSNTVPEKIVAVGDTQLTNGNYEYTQSDYTVNGAKQTINGTQSSGAAAYGPFLSQSFYTTYDLLDTERIRESSENSNLYEERGRTIQPVYGASYATLQGEDLPIYSDTLTSSSKYGTVYGSTSANRQYFNVYAYANFKDSGERWGLVGVMTSAGNPEMGWVQLYDGSSWHVDQVIGAGDVIYDEYFDSYNYTTVYQYVRKVSEALQNNWVYSNVRSGTANNGFNNFLDENGDSFSAESLASKSNIVSSTARGEGTHPADIYYDHFIDNHNGAYPYDYAGPVLDYANEYKSDMATTNNGPSMYAHTLQAVNGTDLLLTANHVTAKDASGNRLNYDSSNVHVSVGMTRQLDTPIIIKQGKTGIHASYPVLYYDFANQGNGVAFALTLLAGNTDDCLEKNNEAYLYWLNGNGELVTEYTTTGDKTCGYFSFENIMNDEKFKNKTLKIAGISMFMWTSSATEKSSLTIRRMEIWQEETDWLDEIISANQYSTGDALPSNDMTAPVQDSMNIVNDAFFHFHDETKDGDYEIVTSTNENYDRTNQQKNVTDDPNALVYLNTVSDNTKSETLSYTDADKNTCYYDRTVSYRKTNSNKGWTARVMTDTDNDGDIVWGEDTVYEGSDANAIDGVYEYRTSLGHLRVWVPAATTKADGTIVPAQASVVFEADRSFNTDNYKYLYYSYSMRDPYTGIAAADPDSGSGINLAIKGVQLTSDTAYLEKDGTWEFYPKGEYYLSTDGHDNRSYNTTMNAALDLSTLEGLDSVNQFVFYLNNTLTEKAEFYINYLYLSNVPPSQLVSTELEETQVQYYYMMDNTGDRYSARFPTIDNPTGAVSGTNSDNSRNNPVIVERGALLSEGKYFNGEPLFGYGDLPDDKKNQYNWTVTDGVSQVRYLWVDADADHVADAGEITAKNLENEESVTVTLSDWSIASDLQSVTNTKNNKTYTMVTRVYDNNTATEGYYEKLYGTAEEDANAEATGSFMNIWFYAGGNQNDDDHSDIKDFYDYKDRERDSLGNRLLDAGEVTDANGNTVDVTGWTVGDDQRTVSDGANTYEVTKVVANHYEWTVNGVKYTWLDALDGVISEEEIDGDGEQDIYDMLWSYGRWYTGEGESGLNNMYVQNVKEYSENGAVSGNHNEPGGNLTRRYATENYVLLRSGIQPRKFLTYYNAEGGQFVYENSTEDLQNNLQLDENSYYITSTVLFSNYTYPISGPNIIEPKKYGFKFLGWYTDRDINNTYETGINGGFEDDLLKKYNRKEQPDYDYFYAKWEADPAYKDVTYTATFKLAADDTTNWVERVASQGGNEFKITLPNVTHVIRNSVSTPIYGWQAINPETGLQEGRVYSPGQRLLVTGDVTMVPVYSTTTAQEILKTVTLHGAELYLVTEVDGEGNPIYTKNDKGEYTSLVQLSKYDNYHGIKTTTSGNSFTYTNLPKDVMVVAIPLPGDYKDTGDNVYGWLTNKRTDGDAFYLDGTNTTGTGTATDNVIGSIVSFNETRYEFSVYESLDLTFTTIPEHVMNSYYSSKAISTVISSTKEQSDAGREMIFVSTFDLSELPGATAVAWGTLYSKNNLYDQMGSNVADWMQLDIEDIRADVAGLEQEDKDKYFELGAFSVKAQGAAYVRQTRATAKSNTNQYYLRITDNKGVKVQYFARSYVVYELNGEYYAAYSNVVFRELLEKPTDTTTPAA